MSAVKPGMAARRLSNYGSHQLAKWYPLPVCGLCYHGIEIVGTGAVLSRSGLIRCATTSPRALSILERVLFRRSGVTDSVGIFTGFLRCVCSWHSWITAEPKPYLKPVSIRCRPTRSGAGCALTRSIGRLSGFVCVGAILSRMRRCGVTTSTCCGISTRTY